MDLVKSFNGMWLYRDLVDDRYVILNGSNKVYIRFDAPDRDTAIRAARFFVWGYDTSYEEERGCCPTRQEVDPKTGTIVHKGSGNVNFEEVEYATT